MADFEDEVTEYDRIALRDKLDHIDIGEAVLDNSEYLADVMQEMIETNRELVASNRELVEQLKQQNILLEQAKEEAMGAIEKIAPLANGPIGKLIGKMF